MRIAWVAVLSLGCATAFAQRASVPDAGTPSAAPKPATPGASEEELRREMEAKLEKAKQEMREEIRAQMATQSVAQGWQEEVTEEKRKLELFVPNGYLRVRPELFNKFDLGRGQDPAGYYLIPRSPVSAGERTIAGVNMRFRFEPTLNVSEEVRIKLQMDALDNAIFGSTPDYAWSRSDRDVFTIFSQSESAPQSGLNAVRASILVKRVYGEVATPVWGGIVRFGRMGSHWGLGMLYNDGNCLDCDRGDTVDRLMFVAEPISGFFVTPMIDWHAVGPTSERTGDGGQPFPLSNQDASISFNLAIARRDVEQQAKRKLQNNQTVFNYGVHFSYRTQKYDFVDFYKQQPFQPGGDIIPPDKLATMFVPRFATLFIPDVWVKFERKRLRLEFEGAAILGNIQNSALQAADADNSSKNQSLAITQFGAVGQSELRFADGALKVGLEVGYASGDRAPGMGNRPGRVLSGHPTILNTIPGDYDGPKFCPVFTDNCSKESIRNFRFNRDYRVDLILWREILSGVTGAIYVKPSLNYEAADGFNLFAAVIYSRAVFPESTPSYTNSALGVEFNAGARYETDDGFFAQFAYGVLFPLSGFNACGASTCANSAIPVSLDNAQALRGMLGIRF